MIKGFQPCKLDRPKVLAVVLHGWGGNPARMKYVIAATQSAFEKEGVDVYAPHLAYARRLRSVRAEILVSDLLDAIDAIIGERGRFERIVIIGYSLGAVIARRLFLTAAGPPTGFLSEPLLDPLQVKPRDWAQVVDRLITISAFNRGWQVSGRMDWYSSFLLNLFGLIGHLSPENWRPTVFDFRLGAPFIVQTRLHWLAFRRLHQAVRHGEPGRELNLLASNVDDANDPIVVQLIGRKDNFASPFDQVDIAVDSHDFAPNPRDRRYFYLEMDNTDHEHAPIFSDTPDGQKRRGQFIASLTASPDELLEIASDPSLLADDSSLIETDVTDAVFIMHGIRDDGFWTHHIAKEIRERAEGAFHIRVRTPTYGYFAMLPFILPWIRRQKVEWLMDQYVSIKAQFPNAEISYVGHSNGTYLAARALKDYAAARFKHVFFAGSVVRRDYNWSDPVKSGRVCKVHNVPAAADWVVALLPKSIEWLKKFDLGGAGFDGFEQAGEVPNVTQSTGFAKGAHSAAIAENQWPHIAGFIVDGVAPPELPKEDFVATRSCWLVPLAKSHIGLPFLALLFGIVVPSILAWPLLQSLTGVGLEWPYGLTIAQAIAVTFVFVGYWLLLKFIITRV